MSQTSDTRELSADEIDLVSGAGSSAIGISALVGMSNETADALGRRIATGSGNTNAAVGRGASASQL